MASVTLAIQAQDIREITIGLVQDQKLIKQKTWNAPPEEYLARLQETLSTWGVSFDLFEAIVVVTGPGSATATRVSVTIANTLGFALNLPVYGLENSDQVSLKELMATNTTGASEAFVFPVYQRPPIITKPNHSKT